MEEVYRAGQIRIESKRLLLWEIAKRASGMITTDETNVQNKTAYSAAVAAINELNRMDGHHRDPKLTLRASGFTFDAEILPPELEAEDAEVIQAKLIEN